MGEWAIPTLAVLLLGYGGTALSFVWLSRVHSMGSLIAAVVAYGLFISFVDLGANSVGSDYEHLHGVRAMNGLHAGFSLGGLLGALGSAFVLWSGADFRAVYLGLALVLAVAAAAATVAPLPVRARAAAAHRNPPPQQPVWRIPAVCFAIALIAVTFFGDGALESFLAVYFRGTLGSSVLLTGAGLAAYHLASLTGRLLATRVLRRWKERATVLGAGVFAAGGIALAVLAPSAGLAISGLLLVGLAIAPVVPSALSLAGRAAPGRAAQAVAVSTASGYGVYVFSPLAVGELAQATNLRVGLALLIATSLVIAVLGSRWPAATDEPSRPTGQGAGTTAPTDAVAGRS